MSRRHKMDRRSSRRSFTAGATRIHRKNLVNAGLSRGGIKL